MIMQHGRIVKALSGFYYIESENGTCVTCRGRGKLRHDKITPLVGDWAEYSLQPDGSGSLEEVCPRTNEFQRPSVANIEALVLIASGAIPTTDPFLIDRVTAIAGAQTGCESIICINKCDLNTADALFDTYTKAGFLTLRVSAETGQGIDELSAAIAGKVCAFTGNSGVGKSSILNALNPLGNLAVGEISTKLGRGRHTTRHVELFHLPNGAFVADTPGFSSFETDGLERMGIEHLAEAFIDFEPYVNLCKYTGCAHVKESHCAVLEALAAGKIAPSRHESYVRLYEQAKLKNPWDLPKETRK